MELSEETTKEKYITPNIVNKGWVPGTNSLNEYPYTVGKVNPLNNKREERTVKRLDYLLIYPAYNKLALIEAKKYSLPSGTGMQQGLNYAKDLQIPFVFTSNGHNFVFYNRLTGKQKTIDLHDFPTKDQLLQKYIDEKPLNQTEQKLLHVPYYYRRGITHFPRYYQINSVNKTLEAIAHGKKHIMFVNATGTGKTFCAFQIVYRLLKAHLKSHPVRKVLYLVDRNVLANQPLQHEFSAFHNEAVKLSKNEWKDPNGLSAYKIYFGLYQQLFSDKGKDNHLYENFPQNFFDLIIIDEAHRGSANEWSNWHSILNYFAPKGSKTIVVGMTATPKEKKGSNLSYFGEPVYNYSLKQGINDGFLAPYKVIRVELNSDVYGFRPFKGEKDANGHVIEDRLYNTKDFDRDLILTKRTQQVARYVSNYLKKHHMRTAKTIFFCENINHAERMRQDLINENPDLQKKYHDDYVAQITGNLPDAQAQLARFEDRQSPYPTLVTTSKLLRTGVNARDVKVIVLDTSIESMTEFKQIIGRGTRLDTNNGKYSFVIIDFRNDTRLFSDPDFDGKPKIQTVDKAETNQELQKITPKVDDNKRVTSKVKHVNNQKHHQYIYRVNDRNVKVLDAQVSYVDAKGHLITTNVKDYSKTNLKGQYANLHDFLTKWKQSDRKTALLKELQNHGVLMSELRRQTKNSDRYDDFDLLVHLAYDRRPLTKKERVNNVKKQGVLSKYRGVARDVILALLYHYQKSSNISDLESLQTLELPDFSKFGGAMNVIMNDFHGKDNYDRMIHNLTNDLYTEV